MRLTGSERDPIPLPEQRFTTLWHGEMDATPNTWKSRNIASLTSNAVGDMTLTFQAAYQATPYIGLGTGEDQTYASLKVAPTGSSARIITSNGSNALVLARKASFLAGGLF